MDVEQIIKLIQTVSKSELTHFSYEENGTKMVFKKERGAGTTVVASGQEKQEKTYTPTPDQNIVCSPLVGTFYAAPAPEEEPFVKVGDRITKGQTLGIVEAMKLMNEIESEFDGVVAEILVENGSVIEYGQPMFVIE